MEVAFNSPQQRVMFLEQLTPERLLIALQPAMRQLMPACASIERLARVSYDTGREFVRQWLLQAFRGLATQSPPRQFCSPTGATYPDGQPKIMCDNGWEAPIDLRTIIHYTYWASEPTSIDRDLRACAQALQVPQYVRGLAGLQTRDLLDFEGTGTDFFGPFMSGNFRQAERTARRFIPTESSGYTWDLMMILSVFESLAVRDCHSASDRDVFSFSIADPRIKRTLEEAAKNPHTTAVVFPFPLDVMGGNLRTGAECPPAVVYLGQPGFDGPGGPAQPLMATASGGLTSAAASNPYASAMGATVTSGVDLSASPEMHFRQVSGKGTRSLAARMAPARTKDAASQPRTAASAAEPAESTKSAAEEMRFRAKTSMPADGGGGYAGGADLSATGSPALPSTHRPNFGQGISGAYGASPYSGTAAYPAQVGYGAYGHGYSTAFSPGYTPNVRGTAAVGKPGQPGLTLVMPQTNIPIRVDSNGYAAVPPLACANIVRTLAGKRSACAMRSEGAQPGGTERGEALTAPRGEFRFTPFSMFAVIDNRYAGVAPGPEAVPGAGPLQVYQLVQIEQPPPNVLNVLRMSDSGEPSLWYYPQPQMAPHLA